jgi:hypothetical protein
MGERGKCTSPPQYFFYPRIVLFLATDLKRGKFKKKN